MNVEPAIKIIQHGLKFPFDSDSEFLKNASRWSIDVANELRQVEKNVEDYRTLDEVLAEMFTPEANARRARRAQIKVEAWQTKHHIINSIPRSHGKRARFKARLRNART